MHRSKLRARVADQSRDGAHKTETITRFAGHLVVVHCHDHLDEPAGESKRCIILRDGRAAFTPDIQAHPRDKVIEVEPRLDTARRDAVDQQCELSEGRPSTRRRLRGEHETADTHTKLVLSWRYWGSRSYDHVLAPDLHVVHKEPGLEIRAVAAIQITVGNENAITRFMGLDVRLDEIASAADIRCNFGGQVPHPSMEDVALTSPMEPVSIGQLCDTGPSSLARLSHHR